MRTTALTALLLLTALPCASAGTRVPRNRPAAAQDQGLEERRAALQQLVNQGNSAFRNGQYGSAESLYVQALAGTNPALPLEQVPLVNRNLAHTRYRMERWESAIEAYVRSDAEDKDQWIAQCHLQLGNHSLALEALRSARVRFPARVEVLEQIAQLHGMLGQSELAAGSYRELLELRPTDPLLHRALASQQLTMGQNIEALDRFELCWRLGERDAEIARLIGDLYLQEGMRLEAAAYYTKYLGLADQVGPEDQFRIGYAYFQGGEMASARQFFEQAIAADSGYAEAHLYMGQAALSEGDVDGALADFRRALEVDGSLGMAFESIGGIELKRGNYDRAVEAYGRAMQLGEVDFSTHYNLVQSLLRAERTELAIGALKSALRAFPQRRELLDLLEVVKKTRATQAP